MTPEERLARDLRHMDARVLFEERLRRLDPELWRPPLQWHPPVDHAHQDAVRAWRRRNRPFRRAFVGGEKRRAVLMAAGLTMAASRARKAVGL